MNNTGIFFSLFHRIILILTCYVKSVYYNLIVVFDHLQNDFFIDCQREHIQELQLHSKLIRSPFVLLFTRRRGYINQRLTLRATIYPKPWRLSKGLRETHPRSKAVARPIEREQSKKIGRSERRKESPLGNTRNQSGLAGREVQRPRNPAAKKRDKVDRE